MDIGKRLLRVAAYASIAAQAAACGSLPSLPPTETIAVGERPHLVCRTDEVQWCRDHGHALRCTCSPF